MAVVDDYLDARVWRRNREPLDAVEGAGWEPTTSKAGRHKAGTRLAQIENVYDRAIEDALKSVDYEIGDPLGVDIDLPEIYGLIDTANDFAEEGILPRGISVPTSLAWSNAVPSMGGSPSSPWEAPDPANDREWALQAFRRARRLYSTAMQTALDSGNRSEYLALEERYLETYYFEIAHPDLHPRSCHTSCAGGLHPERAATLLNVLQARLIDRMTNGASAADVAEALIDLADLYPNKAALGKYQRSSLRRSRQSAWRSCRTTRSLSIRPASTEATSTSPSRSDATAIPTTSRSSTRRPVRRVRSKSA
jgi:hypothetical protein